MHIPCTHANVGQVTQSGARKPSSDFFKSEMHTSYWSTDKCTPPLNCVPVVLYLTCGIAAYPLSFTGGGRHLGAGPGGAVAGSLDGGQHRRRHRAPLAARVALHPGLQVAVRLLPHLPRRPAAASHMTVLKEAIIDIALRNLPNRDQIVTTLASAPPCYPTLPHPCTRLPCRSAAERVAHCCCRRDNPTDLKVPAAAQAAAQLACREPQRVWQLE